MWWVGAMSGRCGQEQVVVGGLSGVSLGRVESVVGGECGWCGWCGVCG